MMIMIMMIMKDDGAHWNDRNIFIKLQSTLSNSNFLRVS